MSIYPVPLQKWFPNTPKEKSYYWAARMTVDLARCENCGKRCKYNRAWGHHSIPWGYGEVWCTKECLYGPKKRKRTPRKKKNRGKRKKYWHKLLVEHK